jgi:hypothetical protein
MQIGALTIEGVSDGSIPAPGLPRLDPSEQKIRLPVSQVQMTLARSAAKPQNVAIGSAKAPSC